MLQYLFRGRVDGPRHVQIRHLWRSVGHRGRKGRSGGRVRLWLRLDWGVIFLLVQLRSTLLLLKTRNESAEIKREGKAITCQNLCDKQTITCTTHLPVVVCEWGTRSPSQIEETLFPSFSFLHRRGLLQSNLDYS